MRKRRLSFMWDLTLFLVCAAFLSCLAVLDPEPVMIAFASVVDLLTGCLVAAALVPDPSVALVGRGVMAITSPVLRGPFIVRPAAEANEFDLDDSFGQGSSLSLGLRGPIVILRLNEPARIRIKPAYVVVGAVVRLISMSGGGSENSLLPVFRSRKVRFVHVPELPGRDGAVTRLGLESE